MKSIMTILLCAVSLCTAIAQQPLEVEGLIKIQGDPDETGEAGMIRFNAATQDFEGHNGIEWVSLTNQNSIWGKTDLCTYENQSYTGDDQNARFGFETAMNDEWAFIGAPFFDAMGQNNQGAVFVYKLESGKWTINDTLFHSGGSAGDNFGNAVDVDGDRMVASAFQQHVGDSADVGKLYVFELIGGEWVETHDIVPFNIEQGMEMGYRLSIDNDVIVAASLSRVIDGIDFAGEVQVFRFNGLVWTVTQVIQRDPVVEGQGFGSDIGLENGYMVVGHYIYSTDEDTLGGAAHIYLDDGSTFKHEQILLASNIQDTLLFGLSVSISGDYIAVSNAKLFEYIDPNVYIFHLNGSGQWIEETLLTSPEDCPDTGFGVSLDMWNDHLMIGITSQRLGSPFNVCMDKCYAYIYKREGTNWHQQAQLAGLNGQVTSKFGTGLSIYGNHCLVTDPEYTVGGGNNEGQIYFYKRD